MKLLKKYSFTLLFSLSLIICMITSFNHFFINQEEYATIEVKPGDTLWNYANEYAELHHFSASTFVEWVEIKNNMADGKIKVGQKIILPIDQRDLNKETVALNE